MSTDPRVMDYCRHMLRAIERIDLYILEMDLATFLSHPLTQDAVIRNIEIMGEAARLILQADPEFARAHAEIPWQVMYAMRNRVSHGYFDVDLELIWGTITSDIPPLEQQIRKILQA
jgi:uncharacterized protein with HEPN domain